MCCLTCLLKCAYSWFTRPIDLWMGRWSIWSLYPYGEQLNSKNDRLYSLKAVMLFNLHWDIPQLTEFTGLYTVAYNLHSAWQLSKNSWFHSEVGACAMTLSGLKSPLRSPCAMPTEVTSSTVIPLFSRTLLSEKHRRHSWPIMHITAIYAFVRGA